MFCFRYDEESGKTALKLTRFSVVLIVVLLLFVFVDPILTILYDYCQIHNLTIELIDKCYLLLRQNNLLNGRNLDFVPCIEGIMDSPFWGNGFDMFEHNTGYVYPHNLILQLLYDGGTILLMIVLTPLIRFSVRLLNCCNYYEMVFCFFLLTLTVPGMMVSGDIWEKYTFWYYFAWILLYGRTHRNKSKGLGHGTYNIR